MPGRTTWSKKDLIVASKTSTSIWQVIQKLGLKPAGGNYDQVKKYLKTYQINISHFKGKAWNKGMRGIGTPRTPLHEILTEHSIFQSYKLKNVSLHQTSKVKPVKSAAGQKSQKMAEYL